MEEREIDLESLLKIPLDFLDQNIIFRGVENYDYELIPKIGRPGVRRNINNGKHIEYDRAEDDKLLGRFKREALPNIKIVPDSTSTTEDEDWLCIARHHVLPTRLLDWTHSPLIAAYFACKPSGIIHGVETDAATSIGSEHQ